MGIFDLKKLDTNNKMNKIESLHLKIVTNIPVLKNKLEIIGNRFEVDTEKLLIELIKYLVVTNENNKTTSPSYLVDLAWHEFILFTKYYHLFCMENFGKFIHHTPDSKTNKTGYEFTLKSYKELFGLPPEDIWTKNYLLNWKESSCGACHN
ncbi:MAG: hypothetical protein ABJL44_16395 [Algibacter sp.]